MRVHVSIASYDASLCNERFAGGLGKAASEHIDHLPNKVAKRFSAGAAPVAAAAVAATAEQCRNLMVCKAAWPGTGVVQDGTAGDFMSRKTARLGTGAHIHQAREEAVVGHHVRVEHDDQLAVRDVSPTHTAILAKVLLVHQAGQRVIQVGGLAVDLACTCVSSTLIFSCSDMQTQTAMLCYGRGQCLHTAELH